MRFCPDGGTNTGWSEVIKLNTQPDCCLAIPALAGNRQHRGFFTESKKSWGRKHSNASGLQCKSSVLFGNGQFDAGGEAWIYGHDRYDKDSSELVANMDWFNLTRWIERHSK